VKVDPPALRSLGRRDPVLGRALKRVAPLPDFPSEGPNGRASRFEALARAITSQQLSTKAAQTIWKRVEALGPRRGLVRPQELLELDTSELRGAGLSHNKTLALRDLAERHEDGRLRLRALQHLEDEAVIEHLVQVRGIGVWTAQMFLIFKLGRLDIMAPGDLGLQEGLKRLDGLAQRPSPAELAHRAQIWKPLRSVASWTLWRLLEPQA